MPKIEIAPSPRPRLTTRTISWRRTRIQNTISDEINIRAIRARAEHPLNSSAVWIHLIGREVVQHAGFDVELVQIPKACVACQPLGVTEEDFPGVAARREELAMPTWIWTAL